MSKNKPKTSAKLELKATKTYPNQCNAPDPLYNLSYLIKSIPKFSQNGQTHAPTTMTKSLLLPKIEKRNLICKLDQHDLPMPTYFPYLNKLKPSQTCYINANGVATDSKPRHN